MSNARDWAMASLRPRSLACVRVAFVMLYVYACVVPLMSGCSSQARKANLSASAPLVSFGNNWLAQNVAIVSQEAKVNPRTGLLEVDASIRADRLEAKRNAAYRLFVRTIFYRDSRDTPVDTSAWSEIIVEPGTPVSYSSTSLTSASDYCIEIAYPEET